MGPTGAHLSRSACEALRGAGWEGLVGLSMRSQNIRHCSIGCCYDYHPQAGEHWPKWINLSQKEFGAVSQKRGQVLS